MGSWLGDNSDWGADFGTGSANGKRGVRVAAADFQFKRALPFIPPHIYLIEPCCAVPQHPGAAHRNTATAVMQASRPPTVTLQLQHRALYASFDRFPSEKGAARHIERVAQTLFESADGGLLYVLGYEDLPIYQREDNIEVFRFSEQIPNFMERAMQFGRRLDTLLGEQVDSLCLCHFRDPWSGVPILLRQDRTYATVYEINGLPSIELPSAYPDISPRTLAKIRAAEEFCWARADAIITPGETLKANLTALGVPADKITVIPNGADLPPELPRPEGAPERYLIYFGAVQRWQGVDVLLRAFALLKDLVDLRLVICISTHPNQAKIYVKLAEKLGIAHRLVWLNRLSTAELQPWVSHAAICVAPLTECARNLEQGCCPLKILEAMAAGVPVVASDLPSVREIVTNGVDGRLVHPERPAELARAVRILLEYPDRMRQMGRQARQKIEQQFTWNQSMQLLRTFYRQWLKCELPQSPIAGTT